MSFPSSSSIGEHVVLLNYAFKVKFARIFSIAGEPYAKYFKFWGGGSTKSLGVAIPNIAVVFASYPYYYCFFFVNF